MFNKYTMHQELMTRVSDRLVDLVIGIQEDFDEEFDLDSPEWHDIEEGIVKVLTSHLISNRIQSESEIEQDILDNHADALSDEGRGR
tara:strand:- start:165 stop:425 length:261 start_codon:yes stop_codon:yes gene_type:complete